MNILYKPVGEKPYMEEMDNMENVPESFNWFVGGPFESETLPIKNGEISLEVVYDRDQRYGGGEENCELLGKTYYGDIFICGSCNDEYCSFPYDMKLAKSILSDLWR